MKFGCPLIAVRDVAASREFYEKVMRQQVAMDLGTNVSFGEGPVFAIQQDFAELVGAEDFPTSWHGNDHELVFEEEDFDGFCRHLAETPGIVYVHAAKEYPWGQRVVRFYDLDFHVIEVGESMACVFRRFAAQGMNAQEVAERTMHPVEYVKAFVS